jgi:protocatechuate 3,4-dioxygenase beta subunit
MKDRRITSRREFVGAGLALLPLLKAAACADAEICGPTVRGAGGPFYREGAPWRAKLCDASEPGQPLIVAGRVTAAGTCEPLKEAVIDIWQADAAGRYDNEHFHLRGRVRADEEGRYLIETILPGNYTDGGMERAKHIHYIVSAPGYSTLTTECYFEGDARNRTDQLVRSSLIITLSTPAQQSAKAKQLKGTFDVVLAKARG